jgi:hypothetical protein
MIKTFTNRLPAHLFFSILTVAVLCLPLHLYASQGKPAIQFDPENEKRSIICTGTGYAYLSKNTSPEQCRQRALSAAKHLILRKCNEILQDRVANAAGKIRFEFMEIQPGEYIRIFEKKNVEAPIRGPGLSCGIQITAEIRYRLIASSSTDDILLSDEQLPLTVRVWSDKQTYKAEERIVFHVRGNRDFFIRIIDKSPDGEMIQLLPSLNRKALFLKGGETYDLPDPKLGDDFNLDVGPPFGKETVLVFASDIQIGQVPFAKHIGAFGQVSGSETQLADEARQVDLKTAGKNKKSGSFSYVEFFESRWLIQTREK